MLDHVISHNFWASVASKNFIVCSADASNAFAESSLSKIPLYVRTGQPFCDWWKYCFDENLNPNRVLPVLKALQGLVTP